MSVFFEVLLGLITFFLYPAIQYILLRRTAKKNGEPELWYLPDYGYRLVIRNIPGKKTLSDIRFRSYLRRIIPPSTGASVETYIDTILTDEQILFVLPDFDQVLLAFLIEQTDEGFVFVHTDKVGKAKHRYPFSDFSKIIVEYTANIENWFNFDVKIGKRVEISVSSLREIYEMISLSPVEQPLEVDQVINAF